LKVYAKYLFPVRLRFFVYLIEKSEDALIYLKKNAKGIENVKIIQGDICKSDSFFELENADNSVIAI